MPDIARSQLNDLTTEFELKITREDVEARTQSETRKVASQIHLKGFRKGKTPSSVVDQRYGAPIRQKVLEDLVEEHYRNVVKEEGESLCWASQPSVEDGDGDIAHIIKFKTEAIPPISEVDLSDLRVKRPVVEVSDEDVHWHIENSRQQLIDWFELKGDGITISDGDRVTVANEPVDEVKSPSDKPPSELWVHMGSGASEAAKSRDEKLRGKTIGDVIEWTTQECLGVEEDQAGDMSPEALAAKVRTTIEKVEVGDPPPLDDDLLGNANFLAALSVPEDSVFSLPDFPTELKEVLKNRVAEDSSRIVDAQCKTALVQSANPTLPREALKKAIDEKLFRPTIGLGYQLLVDDDALDQLLAKNTQAWLESSYEPLYDDEDEPLDDTQTSFRHEFVARMVERYVQDTLFGMALEICAPAFAKQKNIEPDTSWIADQMEEQAKYHAEIGDDDRLDEIYSETNLSHLKTVSLGRQAADSIAEGANIEDWELEFRTYEQKAADLITIDPRDFLTVSPAIKELEVAEDSKVSDEPSQDVEDQVESVQSALEVDSDSDQTSAESQDKPKGLMARLFKRK